nr:HlyD family efflux transporter periplasmic adaptor subunit [uncultured Bacteroides sp.]
MLLPSEFIENSIETYTYNHSTTSQKIYWVVLLAITLALISLPFIYVDISIQGNGIIRPIAEKTEIKAPVTELVDSVYAYEGKKLKKGDIILSFRTSNSEYKILYQRHRIDDYKTHLADLKFLAKGKQPPTFHSPARQQEYNYYIKREKELGTSLDKAEKDLKRNKLLFTKKVISEEDYDKSFYQYETQKNELASLKENQLSVWQTDLNNYQNLESEMNASFKQELKNKELYVVKSPVNGTLDQFSGIYRNSSVQAGQSLAVVSPDSTLYFEVYVNPRNIGYLSVGMPVNFQIESFDYNEWGTVAGNITEISSDFLTDNQNKDLFYKVKCSMKKNYLQLKNGEKGKLKKGMTVSAHFMINKRSLFSLLYQKIDKCINPAQFKVTQH